MKARDEAVAAFHAGWNAWLAEDGLDVLGDPQGDDVAREGFAAGLDAVPLSVLRDYAYARWLAETFGPEAVR